MDKIEQLYNLYLDNGLISEAISLDVFRSADLDQQNKLFELGKEEGLFQTSTVEDFTSAWSLKKKEDTDSVSEDGLLEQPSVPIEEKTQIEKIAGDEPAATFFGDMSRAWKQGAAEAATVDDALGIFFKGKDVDNEDLDEYIEAVSRMDAIPESESMKSFYEVYEKEGKDLFAFIKAIQGNARVLPELFLSSTRAIINPASAAAAGASAAGGAAAGSVVPVIGTGLGAVGGAIAGMSGSLETALAVTEGLKKELAGKDFTRENIRKILEDPAALNRVRSRATLRGGVIGAVDALTLGLSGKLGVQTAKLTGKLAGKVGQEAVGKAVGGIAGAGAGEMIGGAAGETLAQVATGDKLDAADIIFEGITGTVTAPLSVGKAFYSLPKYRIGDVKVTREKFIESINKATSEEILTMEVGVKNDEEVSALMNSKFKDATIERATKEVLPNINEEELTEIVELTKRKELLEANGGEVAKAELPQINNRIKEITNAVQERSAEEVDVQKPTEDSAEVGVRDTAREAAREAAPEEVETAEVPKEEVAEPVAEQEVVKPSVEQVEYVLPEDPKEARKDFEVIDNRNEKEGLEILEDGSGKWIVRNKKTGKIIYSKTKKDAEFLATKDGAENWDYGEGDLIDVEIFAQPESFETKRVKITEPFTVGQSQVIFNEDGTIKSIINKRTKKEVTPSTRSKVEKIILEKGIDVDAGEKAPVVEGLQPEQVPQYIADESNNVREVAQAIQDEQQRYKSLVTEEQKELLDPFGYSNIPITLESWREFGDITKLTNQIKKNWIKKDVLNLDEAVKELPNYTPETEKEIAEDIIEFAINNPSGGVSLEKGKTPALIDLELKFEKLTGAKPTPTNIDLVIGIEEGRTPVEILKLQEQEQLSQPAIDEKGEVVEGGAFGRKRGPAAEKIVAEPKKEITVDEAKALKDQIRLEARAAREAKLDIKKKRAAINDLIKDFKGKGQVTTAQSTVLARKINSLNVDNEAQVEEFIDYADKIIKNAELAEKIRNAENLRGTAKKNITRKIGPAKDLFPALQTLFNIKPAAIPLDKIDGYLSLAESFGAKKAVLTLPESGLALQQAEDIINSIEEKAQKETAKPKKEKKYNLKEEVDKIISNRIDVPSLPKDEKKIADFLNSLSSEDIEALVTEKDGKKSYSNVEKLKNVLANIENGYLTKAASELQVEIEANRNSKIPTDVFKKLKYKPLEQFIERSIAKLKTGLKGTERDVLKEQIRAVPLTNIDEALGNFNKKDIAKATFDPLASSHQKYETDLGRVGNLLREADGLLRKGRVKFTTRLSNKVIKSKYKIMTYQLQREYNSNDGKKGTAPAIEFIDRTIEAIEKGDIKFIKERDAKILNEIKQEFEVDGNIDIDKLENSFTPNEKKALDKIDQANQSLAEKALFTSAVLRGNRVNLFNNYVHHDVLMNSEEAADNLISKQKRFTQPSTKSQTLLERTPGAKPISFDPIASAGRAAKETLLDYHMTQPLRVVNKTISNIINNLESDPNSTKLQKGAARAVKDAFNEINTILFDSTFEEIGIAEKTLDNIKRLGYYSALASVPRAVSELGSNTLYALNTNPVGLARGIGKYGRFSLSSEGANVLDQIGSTQTLKLFGTEDLTGKQVDSNAFKRGRDKRGKALNPFFEKLDLLYNNLPLLKVPIEITKFFAEQLISTPDKAISRPLYFDTFVESFAEATKKSGKQINLTTKDLQEIGEGTSKYLTENQAEIEEARQKADDENIRMATTVNPYSGILKLQRKKGDSALRIAYKAANSYMARFNLFEYATARKALRALYTSGDLTKAQAVGILAGVTARMTSYMLMYQALSTIYDEMLGNIFGLDVEEDKEEELLNQLKRQVIGTGATLILRRGIGNIPAVPISLGIEYLNEKYGEDLREGEEYDEYENSLVFSNISLNEFREKPVENLAVKTFAGPYGPLTRSATRAVTIGQRLASGKLKEETKQKYIRELTERMAIEAAGNAGLLPFYKDIRRAYLKDFFKEPVKKSKTAKFTEEDLKKYKNNPAIQEIIRDRIRKQKKGKKQTSKLPGTKK